MGSTLTAGALLVGRIWLDVLLLVLWAVVEVPKQVLKWATSKRSVPEDVKIFKSVLITGASVGIGRGLARSFAGPGVRLVLTAFRKPSLEETVAECRGLGATVDAHYVDVKDRAAMEVLVAEAQKARPLDLVIANAGVCPTSDGLKESHWVVETNLLGMLNTVLPAVEAMRAHGEGGQVAVLSSMGSYAPATNFYMLPYVTTKTAIRTYGEGLRTCLAPEKIGVTVVCPGFVESRMTVGQAKLGVGMIGFWSNAEACQVMSRGIAQNVPEVAFPALLYVLGRLVGNLPAFVREMAGQSLGKWDPFDDMEHRTQSQTLEIGLNEDTLAENKVAVTESVVSKAARVAAIAVVAATAVAAAVSLASI